MKKTKKQKVKKKKDCLRDTHLLCTSCVTRLYVDSFPRHNVLAGSHGYFISQMRMFAHATYLDILVSRHAFPKLPTNVWHLNEPEQRMGTELCIPALHCTDLLHEKNTYKNIKTVATKNTQLQCIHNYSPQNCLNLKCPVTQEKKKKCKDKGAIYTHTYILNMPISL